MQLNITSRAVKRRTRNIKIFKTIIYFLVFLLLLFLLERFHFPYPKQEIKKNITNEIIKLK